MKKKAKPFKCIFLVGWGTYTNQTVVAVNTPHKEIVAYLKRIGAKKSLVDKIIKDEKYFEHLLEDDSRGAVFTLDGASVLWLKEYGSRFSDFGVIIHEIHHLVTRILEEGKGMVDEIEALAYQNEYLFLEITKKIDTLYYKNNK